METVARPTPPSPRSTTGGGRVPDARSLAAFTATVALFAIFADASIGHGLAWENDPYWTYWVTKTFLIATVFGLGTAWVGVGVWQGAAITAVHTLVLTVYYWSLSPIGLPANPEWLDLEHTWLTGLPIHFGVIYLGYLLALFAWSRRGVRSTEAPGRLATEALLAAFAIVVISGALVALALWEFPGATWFIVRLLITCTFLLLWWGLIGRDIVAAAIGGVALALIWTTYGHFLGPSGLPGWPLRLLSADPPPTTVHWLGYRDLWLVSLPIVALIATGTLVLWTRHADATRLTRRHLLGAGVPLAALVVPLLIAALFVGGGGTDVRLRATGPAQIERGSLFSGELADADGSLVLSGEDAGGRVTPLPPHDRIALHAQVNDGASVFEIDARDALVEDPLGRFTTWWGIGLNVWHHGRSGIGTDRVPATHSKVALFAQGSVRSNDQLVASSVPVHVMTMADGLDLIVGDPAIAVAGLPSGHLRAHWHSYTGGATDELDNAGYAVGSTVLAAFLVIALLAATGRVTLPPKASPE
jgi:hypothetical protein